MTQSASQPQTRSQRGHQNELMDRGWSTDQLRLVSLLVLGLGLFAAVSACGPRPTGGEQRGPGNTVVGNPMVQLVLLPAARTFSPFSVIPSSPSAGRSEFLGPAADSSAFQAPPLLIGLCTKRIRFKPADDNQLDEDVEITPGWIQDDGQGSPLASVQIPSGRYRRIDIDLDDRCGRQVSVQITNSFGSFQTSDGLRIRFEGTIVIGGNQTVLLQMDPIRAALSAVQASAEIEAALDEVGSALVP